jgi:pimeloyl-ACP methyl ester carboxylesterase
MKNKIIYFIIFFFCLISIIQAQVPIENLNACIFSINQEQDTIQFIKIDKDLETVKPTIVFCQGSLPIPLVINYSEKDKDFSFLNIFDYKKIARTYNIIVISMPFTPIEADDTHLNSQGAYIIDVNIEHSYHPKYLQANYLEKYVERGNLVIKFLLQQKWVDKNRLFIVGHSQGAKLAAKIAFENKNISALGFLSGNPLGRVDQFIRQNRLLEQKGLLSSEKAQEEINKIYQWWDWINQHAGEPSKEGEDSPQTTISFSKPVIDDLIKLTIPLYIAYGTEDIGASYCDLLPIDFIRVGKKNYKLVPYAGLDHNYMEMGNIDKCHWGEVIDDFISWLERK